VKDISSSSSLSSSLPKPPIDTYIQVIDAPGILKLTSIDLQCEHTYTHLHEIFDFGKDYLGLIKASVIASGIIPIGLEQYANIVSLGTLFDHIIGNGKGLHITTHVHDIPKGSRLAVSTNLLASIITACMRISNQTTIGTLSSSTTATTTTTKMAGPLQHEKDRRLIAARCILGEWLGGSGGGWQDSGGENQAI
jgi:hypothetical protein